MHDVWKSRNRAFPFSSENVCNINLIYIKSLGRSNFFILELEFIIDKRMIL